MAATFTSAASSNSATRRGEIFFSRNHFSKDRRKAEFGLGNKAGLIAAYKEAAKHPETAQQANDWLRKNGGK